ncbi:hypothetical protein Aph01nite_81110 [Acrocarpospora phusangensis]|uniref:Uncharacterized protein n=1 Tax=Acrocarpospora phusangensis TaxID=1070424 RepID=A0A919QJ39_9ACTN|nr:hypothetical protein [Acrocarpospora phusangensis]GIH29801.1 hypothetical protein Aph01nite_81110 [Acrocarpospora phusangensis]
MSDLTLPAAVWVTALAVLLALLLAVVLLARAGAAARRLTRMAEARETELAAEARADRLAAEEAAATAEEYDESVATLRAALARAADTAVAGADTDVPSAPRCRVRRRLHLDPQRHRAPEIYRQALSTFRPLMSRGELPTFRAVMKALDCGQRRATTVRAYLAAKLAGDDVTARRVVVDISAARAA